MPKKTFEHFLFQKKVQSDYERDIMPLFDSVAATLGPEQDQTFGYLQSKNIAHILKTDGPHLEIIREKAINADPTLKKQA
jgi:hypothetical protein